MNTSKYSYSHHSAYLLSFPVLRILGYLSVDIVNKEEPVFLDNFTIFLILYFPLHRKLTRDVTIGNNVSLLVEAVQGHTAGFSSVVVAHSRCPGSTPGKAPSSPACAEVSYQLRSLDILIHTSTSQLSLASIVKRMIWTSPITLKALNDTWHFS